MYTATMRYTFTERGFEDGCALWKTLVLERAKTAPGMVRMQFLTAKPIALAIGTWRAKADAEAFMRTGVFKELTATLGPLLESQPVPELWELSAFAEGERT